MRKSAPTSPNTAHPRERVHRLTDIDVDEVSLVDHAANKRKWLVVKRSTMGIELESDGKGGFTKAGTKQAACGPDGKKKPMAKMDLPPGAREVLAPVLQRACDKLTAMIEEIDGASVAEVGEDGTIPPLPEEVWAGIGEAAALLGQVERQYPRAAAPAPENEEPAPESEGGTEAEEDELEMRFEQATKALVAKVGRRMSKDRLARFEQALSVLGSILGELKEPSAEPAEMRAPEAPAEEQKRAPAAKADDGLAQQLATLSEQVQRMTSTIVKQRDELAQLRKARGGASSVPVEDNAEPRTEFSWPLDMNRPVTRDSVTKTTSFFDND